MNATKAILEIPPQAQDIGSDMVIFSQFWGSKNCYKMTTLSLISHVLDGISKISLVVLDTVAVDSKNVKPFLWSDFKIWG
jgi:hypothetical protein